MDEEITIGVNRLPEDNYNVIRVEPEAVLAINNISHYDKYYITCDDDGYVLYLSFVGDGDYVTTIDGLDLSGDRIRYHRLIDGELVFDNDKYSSDHVEESPAVVVSQLDRIEAQVTYTALKTGTLIGE